MAEGVSPALIRQRLARVLLAGVVSGTMAALPVALPVASLALLSLLAPLPLLIYGFRFGWQAAVMAGVAGWGVHGVLAASAGAVPDGHLFLGLGALLYLLWTVLPALVASALVQQRVHAGTVLGVLAACGAVAAAVVVVTVPTLGQVWHNAAVLLSQQMQLPEAEQQAAEAQLAQLAAVLPGMLGAVWLFAFTVNFTLASRFMQAAGFGEDVPRFRSMRVATWTVIAAVVCLTASGVADSWASVGPMLANAGVVLLAAVFLGGLALVHDRAAQLAQPGVALMLFYLLGFVLAVPFLLVLLAGAADAFFDFRNSSFRSRSSK